MKVTLKAHTKLFKGDLNKQETLEMAGLNAGICYMPDTFEKLEAEDSEKKLKRANRTIIDTHHSVVGHSSMELIIEGIPKICAMILNNLGEYNTSEKSARYTEMTSLDPEETKLYDKWKIIFKVKIKELYGGKIKNEKQIDKLAMENARYVLSVFTPTVMAYTTSVRQLNYIVDWCRKMCKEEVKEGQSGFFSDVAIYMNELAYKIEEIAGIENLNDTKNRAFNLFNKNVTEIGDIEPFFGHTYQTTYKGTFAQLAQAQRHRTIDYVMYFDGQAKFFYVPPILEGCNGLVKEWLEDLKSLADKGKVPQATLVDILEMGTAENFLLKTKERECGCAQLEIQRQTIRTHELYEASPNLTPALKEKFKGYSRKVRCAFDDFKCPRPCIWGVTAIDRKI